MAKDAADRRPKFTLCLLWFFCFLLPFFGSLRLGVSFLLLLFLLVLSLSGFRGFGLCLSLPAILF